MGEGQGAVRAYKRDKCVLAGRQHGGRGHRDTGAERCHQGMWGERWWRWVLGPGEELVLCPLGRHQRVLSRRVHTCVFAVIRPVCWKHPAGVSVESGLDRVLRGGHGAQGGAVGWRLWQGSEGFEGVGVTGQGWMGRRRGAITGAVQLSLQVHCPHAAGTPSCQE